MAKLIIENIRYMGRFAFFFFFNNSINVKGEYGFKS